MFAPAEAFIICKRLALPEGMTPDSLMGQWKQDRNQTDWTPTERLLLPFLFGGSLLCDIYGLEPFYQCCQSIWLQMLHSQSLIFAGGDLSGYDEEQ